MSLLAVLSLLPFAPLAFAGLSAGTTYTISPSSHPDYCLAPSSATEGAELVLKPCDTASDIVFTLDGDELRNTETNMCIDVRDGNDRSGTLLQMWSCYGYNTNQRFDVNGEEVKWVGRDRCLDLKDGLGQEGNEVQIWSCYGHNTNQRWTFTEAEEIDGDADDCDDSESPSLFWIIVRLTDSAGTPTAPSTPAPAPSDNAEDCDEYGNPLPSDDDDDDEDEEDLPECDEASEGQAQEQTHSYVRRGRGQHWQRELDSQLEKLDRSYIPHAPVVERRSRRRNVTQVSPTSTGL